MADVQILAGGTKAAPLAYTIPGAQEIVVKALFATFDGTAAGGAFLPCIRILSPANKVVGEYVTDASVAAGSSAEVSFAPFLRSAPSAAADVDRIWWFGASLATFGQTIPDSVETQLAFDTEDGPFIGAGSAVEFGTTPNDEIRFTSLAGQQTYFARLTVYWNAAFAGYRYIRLGYDAPAGAVSNMLELQPALVDQQDALESNARQFMRKEYLVPAFVFVAGRYLRVRAYVYQASGGPQDTANCELEVYGVKQV